MRTTLTWTATCRVPRPAQRPSPAARARRLGRDARPLGHRPRTAGGGLRRPGRPLRGAGLVAAALDGPRGRRGARRRPGGLAAAGGALDARRRVRRGRRWRALPRRAAPAMPTHRRRRAAGAARARACARRARGRALPRRGRAARPGGRPHPRRDAALLQGQPAAPTAASSRPRSCAPSSPRCATPPAQVVHQCGSRRHRLPQPAGDGARRPGRRGAVPGLVERVVRRPGAARWPAVDLASSHAAQSTCGNTGR